MKLCAEKKIWANNSEYFEIEKSHMSPTIINQRQISTEEKGCGSKVMANSPKLLFYCVLVCFLVFSYLMILRQTQNCMLIL